MDSRKCGITTECRWINKTKLLKSLNKTTMITEQWAKEYCQKIMSLNNLNFPFSIGRKKNWGGIDAISVITDENSFFRCYKEFDEHPRCTGIFLNIGEKFISI